MVIEWTIANKELLKILYALAISFICALIVIKSDRLFKISDYQGIRYFRNAFFFFGLSVIVRFILGPVTTTNPNAYSVIITFLSGFFILVGGLFLFYSLVWKKIENEKKYHSLINLSAFVFYLISSLISWIGLTSHLLLPISQIVLLSLILVVSLVNYLKSGNDYSFLRTYVVAMVLGLLAQIIGTTSYFISEIKIIPLTIYGLNLLFFFLFLKGVMSLTKNGEKKR